MTNPKQTFRKDERLCDHKLIAELFKNGKFVFEYPFKVFYLIISDDQQFRGNHPAQILLTVPKRQFKKAVVRNHIRRLIKEGYRKNKALLYDYLDQKNIKLVAGIVYIAKAPISAGETEQKIIKSLQRLTQTIDNSISGTKSLNHYET